MGRARGVDSDDAGQDSFLDIVANTVGILILLVMVVAVRAANRPQQETPPPAPSAEGGPHAVTNEQVEKEAKRALDVRRRITDLGRRIALARREVAEQDADRVDLTALVASMEDEVQQRKQRLSAEERRDFELAEKARALEAELEKLMREQVSLANAATDTEVIENLPTPLAKRVTGEEMHIRIAGGRAAVMPMARLLDAYRVHARENLWRLDTRDEVTLTVGPIDGFRMRYTLQKVVMTVRGGVASAVQTLRADFLPTSPVLGEPVSEALRSGSALSSALERFPARSTAVTVWTYPDSFDEFRELKSALHERGYAVAGRPMEHGDPIGASPQGTASAAQ